MTERLPAPAPLPRVWPKLLAVAIAVTVINAFKPLAIDDAINFEYARQIAHHPTDPYGFQLFWTQWPEPANWMLVPPVMPYWWAIAIRFFGPSVFVWKLWLLPWIAAFVFSVHTLLRRFSPSVAMVMTIFIVFEPVTFPAINYMLDLPAMGLGLLGLCVAMDATDRKSIGRVVLAGVLMGLAMQTKYNMVTLPAAAAVYGLTRRQWVRCVIPGLVALAVFVAIELLFAARYGSSHFWWTFRGRDLFDGHSPLRWVLFSAVPLAGGIGGPLALLMLYQLGLSKPRLVLAGGVVITAFVITALGPVGLGTFTTLGALVWIVFVVTIVQFVRNTIRCWFRLNDLFLLGWLGIESAGFAGISTFGAARRLFVPMLLLALLTARLLDRGAMTPGRSRTLRRLTAFSALFGFGFFGIDCLDAGALKAGAYAAADVIAAHRQPGQRAFYKGHWGFQFYCESLGMEPVVPDHTVLHPGDWLVCPEEINMQSASLPSNHVTEIGPFTIDDPITLETEPAFYGRYAPINYRPDPRLVVTVYHVTSTFVPKTDLPASQIIEWTITRPRPLLPNAVPAVLAAMKHATANEQSKMAQAIIAGGRDTLFAASHDADADVRDWANAQLARLDKRPALSASGSGGE